MHIIDKEALKELLIDLGAKDFEIEVSKDGYCEVHVNDYCYLITEEKKELESNIEYGIETYNMKEAEENPTIEPWELPSCKSLKYSNLEDAINKFLEFKLNLCDNCTMLFLEVKNNKETILEDCINGNFVNTNFIYDRELASLKSEVRNLTRKYQNVINEKEVFKNFLEKYKAVKLYEDFLKEQK